MTVAESISDQAAKDSVTSELVSSLAALWCNGIPASSSFFPFLFFVFTWKTYTVCWSENTTRKQIVQIMDWMKSSKASFFKHMHISISEHATGACPEGVIIANCKRNTWRPAHVGVLKQMDIWDEMNTTLCSHVATYSRARRRKTICDVTSKKNRATLNPTAASKMSPF